VAAGGNGTNDSEVRASPGAERQQKRGNPSEEKSMTRRFVVPALALAVGLMGCFSSLVSAAPPAAQDAAAQVNGKKITYQELNGEFLARTRVPFDKVQDDPQAQQARKELLQQLIDGELVLEQAEQQKLTVTPQAVDEQVKSIRARFPSDEAFKQALSSTGLNADRLKTNIRKGMLRQQVLNKEVLEKVSVSPKELETFFNEHKNTYVQEEAVHARHVLIKAAADASPEDDQKAKERAKAVLAKAKKGEDFSKLAAQYSEDSTKDNGGDLGFFGRGRMVKPFEESAFALKAGQISDPVRSQFGYHIIKVEARREAKRLSFAEAKEWVEKDLKREKARARYGEYVAGLRQKAKITVNLK
jgi:peptidyl-prolyl cis-trans isomerase C